jgi:hypothetical protein
LIDDGKVLRPSRLNGPGSRHRVFGIAYGTPHDDVVGAFQECLFYIDCPFLVIGVANRPDSWDDNQEAVPEFAAKRFGLKSGGNDTVTSNIKGASCPGQYQRSYIHLKPKVSQVCIIKAGQNRYGEYFGAIFLLAGSTQDFIIAMDRRKSGVPASKLLHGRSDRLGNIEEFEINKNLLVSIRQPLQ